MPTMVKEASASLAPRGELQGKVIRPVRLLPNAGKVVKAPVGWRIKNWFRKLFAGEFLVPVVAFAGSLVPGVTVVYGTLYGHVVKQDGTVVDHGVMGYHLVVTAGKNYLAGCFPNTNEPENLKYHGFGTGTNAAAAGDTALQTELTTQYATDNTRPTGSQSSSTNTYTTAATLTPDSAVAITEWGLLSQAATGGGTLFDRQVFAAVNLNGTGDSLTTTYVLTIN